MLGVKLALANWVHGIICQLLVFASWAIKPPIPAYPVCELGAKSPIPASGISSASSAVNSGF